MTEKKENILKRVQEFNKKKKESGAVGQRFFLSNEYNEKFKKICEDKAMTKEQVTMYFIDKE